MIHKYDRAIEILQEDGPVRLAEKTTSYLHHKYQKRLLRSHFSDGRVIVDEQLPDVSDQTWHLDEEPLIEYTEPTGDRAPADLAQYSLAHQPARRFVCEIPSCTLVGTSAVGFTADNELILATASGDKTTLSKRGPLFLGDVSTRNVVSQSYLDFSQRGSEQIDYVFPLVPFYNQYYYHWIVEYLPKLRALEKYEQETGIEPDILIPADPPSFVTESLSLLGYGPDRWREWYPGGHSVDQLIVTNHRIHSMNSGFLHSLSDYYWLRKQMKSGIKSTSQASRKIYISRQRADRGRKVLNYGQVTEELESRGFEPLIMESLPLAEQIAIMMESDVIIGPHGAGLVNMIFSDKPKTIELLPENDLRPHFYMLSDLLDFDYESLVVEANDQTNMLVDIQELSTLLDEANVCV